MTSTLWESRIAELEDRLRRMYVARTSNTPVQFTDDWLEAAYDGYEQPAVYCREDPFSELCREFRLSPAEADLFVTAVLPDISSDCAAAFRMLGPSSRPTAAMGLRLIGVTPASAIASGLLREDAPLLSGGLIVFDDPSAPFTERSLRVPDRVLSHLMGGTGKPDVCKGARLGPLPLLPHIPQDADIDALTAHLNVDPAATLYLREDITGAALPTASTVLYATGRAPLLLDPFDLEHTGEELLDGILLEGRLSQGGIIVPVYAEADDPAVPVLSRLIASLARSPLPVLMYGSDVWQERLWKTVPRATFDLRGDTGRTHPLSTAAGAVVDIARRDAALHGGTLAPQTARALARGHAARSLEQFAQHVRPQVDRQDLVLPDDVRDRLDMLVLRVQKREEVLGGRRLRRGRGRGTTALFAGESGTGKSMAAEAVAGDLGLDLYVVSLPAVVSQSFGETERNLDRIFSAAEALDCVVLFDEADTLFSTRGAVKDANDRHDNLRIGYILQRLERFDGLAILTTNLRANVDSAFIRRFDEVIEFTPPWAAVRAELWRRHLTDFADVPCDIDAIAREYPLAGGSIRSAAETAAFTAAAAGRPVSAPDVLEAVKTEYGKLGRLFSPRAGS